MTLVFSIFILLCIFQMCCVVFFFFKQKTAYEIRISDWSSDVCSSDLGQVLLAGNAELHRRGTGCQQDVAGFQGVVADGHGVASGEARAAVVAHEDRKSVA